MENILSIDGANLAGTEQAPSSKLPIHLTASYKGEDFDLGFMALIGTYGVMLTFGRCDRGQVTDGLNYIAVVTDFGRVYNARGIMSLHYGPRKNVQYYPMGDDLQVTVSEEAADAIKSLKEFGRKLNRWIQRPMFTDGFSMN